MVVKALKSKIHRATVTDADINYVGSISIDKNLMESANLLPYEQVQVLNITNGNRLDTYVIEGEKNKKNFVFGVIVNTFQFLEPFTRENNIKK